MNLIFSDASYTQVTKSKSEALLLYLGRNGVSVKRFFHICDKAKVIEPQLVLRRKFGKLTYQLLYFNSFSSLLAPIKVLNPINASKNVNKTGTILKCAAKGFPYPQYEWYWNDLNLCCDQNEILVQNCAEHIFGSYRCRIWNEISISDDWKPLVTSDQQCRSEQFLDFIIEPNSTDLAAPVSKDNCFVCSENIGNFSTLSGTYHILCHIFSEATLSIILHYAPAPFSIIFSNFFLFFFPKFLNIGK